MRKAYQYQLLPTTEQKTTMERWLDMLRLQYNWLLAERFRWWEENRCDINACPLICHLPELRDNPDYYSQKRSVVPLKSNRPWYKEIYSQVLQDCVTRVKLAFDRFVKGDSKGNRSGRPRFKGKNRYRSLTYPQIDISDIKNNRIHLSKIGWIKLVLHRPIPDGFKAKTAIVTKKSDGWYVTITLVAESVPTSSVEIIPTDDNSIALDLGLEKFAALDTGEFVDIPQHFRHSEEKLAKLQRKVTARKKGSRARKLLNRRVGRLHQRIARARKQFHFETAKQILQKAPVVFVEDLAVKNMSKRCKPKQDEQSNYVANGQSRKSGLNKSIADAGWAQFIEILSFKAESAGGKVVKVNPKNTSQVCSNCLNIVPKTLKERWHDCNRCNLSIDRDTNSAILIKKVGLGVSLTIKRSRVKPREAHAVA
ncbi:RNA-guided endonuclease TnpB family protein [Chroococcidiopsis sp. TS-821]|uniref:RNA-guided endonuclease InsQ/TnpB family protein n=1 Tax=Chroococcidiopsis sp. TS-821 TaxID=1378066 RepID=UPI000CEF155E|nr:RNA-guided endonuclease TnpB family protein [Chroococcidiopsis sp. TS-821]PPS41210.1 transposase [Chroococcidiopsis sp. TS-821]